MKEQFEQIKIKMEGARIIRDCLHSPLYISIGLWYHTRPGDYGRGNGDNNYESEAVQSAIREFVDAGFLEINPESVPEHYRATEGLAVWVEAICNVPWPVQRWVVPA